jgi:hypothetical protein
LRGSDVALAAADDGYGAGYRVWRGSALSRGSEGPTIETGRVEGSAENERCLGSGTGKPDPEYLLCSTMGRSLPRSQLAEPVSRVEVGLFSPPWFTGDGEIPDGPPPEIERLRSGTDIFVSKRSEVERFQNDGC